MNAMALYNIATAGMGLEMLRVQVVADNLARAGTLMRAGSPPLQQVVASMPDFDAWLKHDGPSLPQIDLVAQNNVPNRVYEPSHPAADSKGFVSYPGISRVDEMTTMLRASRGYEANLRMFNIAHSLYGQTLRIGESA
ncbi:hypothetical protein E3226_004080 [Legionella geestiana]|nr:hypothetical protein E3226_004080 [Legionella geestiana]